MPLEIQEGYLEVRDVTTQQVITAIEVLSPSNKRPGSGRNIYQAKRQNILTSLTHFVEIDLLRQGEPMPIVGQPHPSDYCMLISRSYNPPQAELYPFNLSQSIPLFTLPLQPNDQEPTIDLHQLLDQAYDRAGYSIIMDYQQDVIPPLTSETATWVDVHLKAQGLR